MSSFLTELDRASLRRALWFLRRQDARPHEVNPAAAQYDRLATAASVRAEYKRRGWKVPKPTKRVWRGGAPIVFLTLQDAEEDELRAELSLTDFELSIILAEIDVLADFCRAASARRVARGKDPTWSDADEAFIQSMRTRQALWIVNATSMIFSFSTKD